MSSLQKIKKSIEKPYTTLNRIELSRSALKHNVSTLAGIADTDVIPVLKANAYGHGLREIASMLNDENIPYLAVDGYFEALRVKEVSQHNILVMGGVDPANFKNMKTSGLTFVVFNQESIEALGQLGRAVNIHLEIDTGMRRHGIRPEQLTDTLQLLSSYPGINLTGVMSHFADADNPTDQSYSSTQAEQFDACVEHIRSAGFDPQWIHLGQSAGLTRSLSKYVNASRPGIALYGINPLEPKDEEYETLQATRPVLSFYSRPSAIQKLRNGDKVSYGLTYTAKRNMTIAVLPVGYYELLPRSISGNYSVRLSDKELSQIGRICMNHCMIDTSDLEVSFDSEFELVSSDRSAPNSVQAICDANDLFSYELLVNINESVRRVIVD